MSCYNGAKWIEEAIESVLAQTFRNFEFIIVDDGSVDASLSIIESLAKMDARLVVIKKSNTGLADSLNVGINRARGNWVARLDVDDVCERTRFEKQYAVANSSPDIVFVGSGLARINESGRVLKTFYYPRGHDSLMRNLRTSRRFPPHSSAFFQTQAVRAIGGYRKRVHRAEDWDLWLRLSEVGSLTAIREPLVRVRIHGQQISHDESGIRAIVDSRMAIVSHWLRIMSVPDPISASNEDFETFRNWITKRLAEDGIFLRFNFKQSVRPLQSSPLSVISTFTKGFYRDPYNFAKMLRERILGETIARNLANEWLARI